MSPEKFASLMLKIQKTYDNDPEKARWDAEELIEEVLEESGYRKGANIFKEMREWYI